MSLIWVLLAVHFGQLCAFLFYTLHTAKSYFLIPKQLQSSSKNFLLRQSDIKLFVEFIKFCGQEHLVHGWCMFFGHIIMLHHLAMDLIILVITVFIWAVVVFFARRTAIKSREAALNIRLD